MARRPASRTSSVCRCAATGQPSIAGLRYPEQALVSVPAEAQYADPVRPFLQDGSVSAQQENDEVLDLADVAGGGRVETRLMGRVTIRDERAAAALEVMSRFAVDPKWLVYLPPTMAPPRTSARPDVLEHPDEVLAYYRRSGVKELLCEEKHMGSRAVLVVCRDAAAARRRFGVEDGAAGICIRARGGVFSPTRIWRRACWIMCGRLLTAAACGTNWRRIG